MFNFNILDKGLGMVSPAHFVYDFSKKKCSCYIVLTDQIHSLVVFSLCDIGQYVYCNWTS